MNGSVTVLLCVPWDESGYRRFYDPDWGYFFVEEGELRRAFGEPLPGEGDLKICMEDIRTAELKKVQ